MPNWKTKKQKNKQKGKQTQAKQKPNKTQSKKKAKTGKTNTPNNKQNNKTQHRQGEQGQLSRRKVMAHASSQSPSAWHEINNQKHSKETKTSPYRKTCEGSNKTLSGNQASSQPGALRSPRVSRAGIMNHMSEMWYRVSSVSCLLLHTSLFNSFIVLRLFVDSDGPSLFPSLRLVAFLCGCMGLRPFLCVWLLFLLILWSLLVPLSRIGHTRGKKNKPKGPKSQKSRSTTPGGLTKRQRITNLSLERIQNKLAQWATYAYLGQDGPVSHQPWLSCHLESEVSVHERDRCVSVCVSACMLLR